MLIPYCFRHLGPLTCEIDLPMANMEIASPPSNNDVCHSQRKSLHSPYSARYLTTRQKLFWSDDYGWGKTAERGREGLVQTLHFINRALAFLVSTAASSSNNFRDRMKTRPEGGPTRGPLCSNHKVSYSLHRVMGVCSNPFF